MIDEPVPTMPLMVPATRPTAQTKKYVKRTVSRLVDLMREEAIFACYAQARKRPMNFVARFAVVVAALLPLWLWPPAGAQDCKGMPPGPAKKQCLVQNHPEVFEA